MVELVKLVVCPKTTNNNKDMRKFKISNNHSQGWKLLMCLAFLHFFCRLLQFADASTVPESALRERERRHFPVTQKSNDLAPMPATTEKSKGILLITQLFNCKET